MPRLTTICVLSVALFGGCGGRHESSAVPHLSHPELVQSCGPDGPVPPSKVILAPENAVSGSWSVVLFQDVPNLPSVSQQVAARHGGTVTALFPSINGFGLRVADQAAPGIALEPTVCFLEQSAMFSGN